MGWLEIEDLSKLYVRSGNLGSLIDQDDPDDDDVDDSTQERDQDSQELDAPLAQDGDHAEREVWALRDINLRIDEGEAVAVVGHTGSGKTTLLRILAGLTLPTSGEVRGSGLVLPLSYTRSPIAGNKTGRQNLLFLEALLGMPKGRLGQRMDEIAAFAGMGGCLDQKVCRYSRSMYSRLSLAAGLLCEPDILLVDESIGGGDPPFRIKVLQKLEELVKQRTTLIFAAQRGGGLVEELCRRAIWLSGGRIVADGPARLVLARYADASDQDYNLAQEMMLDFSKSLKAGVEHSAEQSAGIGGNPSPLSQQLRLVDSWAIKHRLAQTRWAKLVSNRRASNRRERKPRRGGYLRAGRSNLATLSDIRLLDQESRQVSAILPGEPVRIEIEVEAGTEEAEIGLRFEIEARQTIIMSSELLVPFRTPRAGRYLMTFNFEGYLTTQEVERVLYKFCARMFFRRPGGEWEDMTVATARLYVRGDRRQQAEVAFQSNGEATALVDPVPKWLDGVELNQPSELLDRKPMLRPALDWRIYLIEEQEPSSHEGPQAQSSSMDGGGSPQEKVS